MLTYNVTLTSHTGQIVEVSVSGNQTEVVLGLEDGLKHNNKYLITVSAINMVGSVTSHGSGRNVLGECVYS